MQIQFSWHLEPVNRAIVLLGGRWHRAVMEKNGWLTNCGSKILRPVCVYDGQPPKGEDRCSRCWR